MPGYGTIYGRIGRKLAPKFEQLMRKRTRTNALFCIEGVFKNYFITCIAAFRTFINWFALAVFVVMLLCLIFFPIEDYNDLTSILAMLYMSVVLPLITWLTKIYMKHYKAKQVLVFEEAIIVRKGKKILNIISYDELREVIKNKKIRIAKGCLILPIPNCPIQIEVKHQFWTDRDTKLLQFLAEKCELDIPELTKEEMKLVEGTGCFQLWWQIQVVLILFDIFFTMLIWIQEGGNYFVRFLQTYVPLNTDDFTWHLFEFVVGGIFAMILWPVHIKRYKKVRQTFKDSNIFKVGLK